MVSLLLALVVAFGGPAAALKFDAPAGWTSQPPTSSMRVAEFALPKVTGDSEDASVVVYFFGGQGGSVQANIDRWIGQMVQPDGKTSKDVAKTSALAPHALKVSVVDVDGTYTAEMSPGSTDHFNKPNFRLVAAVVETPGGPYYIKLLGPAKTVAKWAPSFNSFLQSLRYEGSAAAGAN